MNAPDPASDVFLVDSPFANVANIARALGAAGANVRRTSDPDEVSAAQKVVLPGVGAFPAARQWLDVTGLADGIRAAVSRRAFLLGICLGHQLLFDVSREMGTSSGLSLLEGEVQPFDGPLPVPQIGWNRIHWNGGGSTLFAGLSPGTPFYFVNSFAVRASRDRVATAEYGVTFTAAAARDRVFGVQFHPEKSSLAGLQVLRNFVACI
jgi:glutamine amidotransferase